MKFARSLVIKALKHDEETGCLLESIDRVNEIEHSDVEGDHCCDSFVGQIKMEVKTIEKERSHLQYFFSPSKN